jgi:prophage antirepressor-like protein
MNELTKIFNYEDNEVRIKIEAEENWFCARDICDVLEIKQTGSAIERLEEDEVISMNTVDSIGRKQEMQFINESGLYSLILTSRKPEAKKFKKWITSEVLPSIRKHGMYATHNTLEEMINDPDFTIKLLTTIKEERRLRIEAEDKRQIFNNKMIATACAKQGGLTAQNNRLQDQLYGNRNYRTIKAMESIHRQKFSWRPLVKKSKELNITINKVQDEKYGEINSYHKDIWKLVHGLDI